MVRWQRPTSSYAISVNGYRSAAVILLLLAHSEGPIWPLTQTSWCDLAHSAAGVLSLSFLVSMNGVRAVFWTTKSGLNMATPEQQPVDEIELSLGNGLSRGPPPSFLPDSFPFRDRSELSTAWISVTVKQRLSTQRKMWSVVVRQRKRKA